MKFTFQPESKPLDGYTIKRAIHRGGFGEVYYALTDAGKEVALKLLKNHLDVELRGVSQCLNLKHPNLVTIFDVKRDADGDHWVIMEYVAGKSLAQVLDSQPDGMPLDEVKMWLAGIVEGLGFLHDRGIVHRDLKPGNIFMESGVVKIGDVGLSKFISESHRSAQTQSVGTVYYMAPEIAHGRYGREVDIYSLGIVLYELLTGRVPFTGESAGEILMKHLSERPDLSAIPRRMRPVLAQSLEKDPLRRTPTAKQLLHGFKQAAAGIDVPLEIPPDSFLHATAADSSTIERERGEDEPDGLPKPIPEDVAHWLGLDRTARHELYRAQLDRWNAARNRMRGSSLKEAIAGDVAKAMEMAEQAARKAKKMAEEVRGKPWRRHRRLRPRRRFSWSAYARDACRAKFPTFWGWGWRDIGGPHRASAPRPAPPQFAAPLPERQFRRRRHSPWFWLLSIPIAAAFIHQSNLPPHHRHGLGMTFDLFFPYAVCTAIVYGIYRSSVFLFRGPEAESFATPRTSPAAGGPLPPSGAAPGTPITENQRAAAKPPGPVGVRRWTILDAETPRLVPFRQRMAELTLSLTYAAFCTAIITAVVAVFGGAIVGPTQIAQFGGTALVASWLILSQAKLMEGSKIDSSVRRIALGLAGAAVGTASYWLNRSLLVDIRSTDSLHAAFDRIGSHVLVETGALGGSFYQPSWAGYVVFFACLFAFRNWWRQADSFRNKRLAVWSIVPSAVTALVLTAIFAFPTVWGTIWAVVISSTVQLSAGWVPPPQRAALMEAAHHA